MIGRTCQGRGRWLPWAIACAALSIGAARGAPPAPPIGDADRWIVATVYAPRGYLVAPPALLGGAGVAAIADDLGLDDETARAFDSIVDEARSTLRARWLGAQERAMELRVNFLSTDELREFGYSWFRDGVLSIENLRRDLNAGALADLERLLGDAQRAALPRALRDHRRRTSLGLVRCVPGDAVDLGVVAWAVAGAREGEVGTVIDRYHDELDGLIVVRDEAAREVERIVAAARRDWTLDWDASSMGKYDPFEPAVRQATLKLVRASSKIAALNRRTAHELAGVMEEPLRVEFLARARVLLDLRPPDSVERSLRRDVDSLLAGRPLSRIARAAYRQIDLHDTPAWPRQIEPLTPEQREAVRRAVAAHDDAAARIRADRDRRSRASNARSIYATTGVVGVGITLRETDDEWQARRGDREAASEAWKDASRRLAELESALADELASILTQEQRIALIGETNARSWR